MAQQMTKKTDPIGTVGTNFEIIEAIKRNGRSGVSELADQLDYPTSTVHSHLNTLESRGYLIKNEDGYDLGLRFLSLGKVSQSQQPLYDAADPKSRQLAEETGEISAVMVEEHGRGIFLCRAEGPNAVELDSYSGYRIYLHSTALGKAILAFLPEQRVDEIIDQHGLPDITENTITDREELDQELEQIREKGIAYDNEERIKGMRAVAVQISDENETVIGAISLAGPTSRLKGDVFQKEYPEMVRSAANVIELDITYR